jgi:alkylation response protein AidB-like acyl-CoA dehydrogenase
MHPTPDDVLGRVCRLSASISDLGPAIEATGELPGEVVVGLRESGVPAMWLPHELGGGECTPADVIDAVSMLAAADGSTGWCAAVAVGTGALAAYLPEAGAREIFPTPSTIVGGSFNPAGHAVVVDGDLRVSGRWGFGSGSRHADWLCGALVVVDASGAPVLVDDGRPDARLAFFPAGDVRIVDTWHALGLQGTGSHDFEVIDLRVPLDHTMTFAFAPWPGGALWRMPPMSLFFAPMAAVPLGIARAAIDELVRLAAVKIPYRSARSLAERDVVQAMVAQAEAEVRSAGAFLREALEEVWASAQQGDEVTMRQRALVRLAIVNASRSGIRAVDLCYEAAGSTAVFRSNPMQRYLRDVRTSGQHVVLASSGLETAGRVLLGLDPDTPLL